MHRPLTPVDQMRNAPRWLEPFVCTPRQRREVKTCAERSRVYRENKSHVKKQWEYAVKTASRQTAQDWSLLRARLPRGAHQAAIGDTCVFVERGARKLPQMWPRGKVVGKVGAWLIVRRRRVVRSPFVAVRPEEVWRVPRRFNL